jgi:hypothetical protein
LFTTKKITTMKMLVKTILSIVLVSFCLMSSAQNKTSHSVGLQLNPYINSDLFAGNNIRYVYALRYSFSIKDHITLGPELSGYYYKVHSVDYSASYVNVGGFFRYSFFPAARVKPFLELSPYYSFFSYKNLPENTYEGMLPKGKDSYLSGYFAPGLSLFNKSKKISLDLFYKFSNKNFINGNQAVLSYRLNFRF